LNQLDGNFGRLINKAMGGLPVTRETFYIQTKDGGFGLYSLHDRFDICKVTNLRHLLSSGIGGMMKRSIAAVAYNRNDPLVTRIEEMQNLFFFDWKKRRQL
jgi:hypothetical protein